MHLISILFFCLASSCDNFVIGISYGGKAIKINFSSNLLVAVVSCLGTFCAMLIGKGVQAFISKEQAKMLGSTLLIIFGMYMLIGSIKAQKEHSLLKDRPTNQYYDYIEHPEFLDKDNSKEIELKEAAILGGILSINNIGFGIGVSVAGLNIYITSIVTFIFSMLFLKVGVYIGHKILNSSISKYSEYISAIIIICLGILELII
ncbi:sporulation membrane protein YtaF [Clostridium thermarum]|nr:sporulation membrane protein YtaF [Clostridium thermarum]